MISVLFIHPAGTFGGASKSLIELWSVLRTDSVEGTVLCPVGTAAKAFSNVGLEVIPTRGVAQWDNTRYGYYRGARWLILIREILLFPITWRKIRKALKESAYDIVHLNEVTLLPWAWFLRRWTNARIVIHVRSLQRASSNDLRTRWLNKTLAKAVDLVIAIDETVRRTLASDLPVTIVHNGLRVAPLPPKQKPTVGQKGNNENTLRVGIVGVLLKLKGLYEFIEAARILVNDRGLNIEFYIVGENARSLTGWKGKLLNILNLAHDVRADLEQVIMENQLSARVRLMGFVSNVQQVYTKIDLLCFPSHLDAAGRPVFEAASCGVPSIVAVSNPTADTIVDGETGICIPYSDPYLLADAIESMYRDRDKLTALGKNARKLAERNFDIEENGRKILALYQGLIGESTTNGTISGIR
jgi:glycosyltransferase involved in cell wall biosynthesis